MEISSQMKRLTDNAPAGAGVLFRGTYICKRGLMLLALLCTMCFFTSDLFARDYFVKPATAGNGDGASWENAMTLSAAITAAKAAADEIHVAKGNHENATTLTLIGKVKMYGGYADNLTGTTKTGRDRVENVTTIKKTGEKGSALVMSAGASGALTLVDGFEITGGIATEIDHGMGVKIGDYAELKNCKIYGNKITSGFTNNSGARVRGGAGVSLLTANAKMTDCTVTGNTTSDCDASGVLFEAGTVKNCIISGNTAGRRAGGVFIVAGTLENCTIINNTSAQVGGGIHVDGPGVTIKNCDVRGNKSTVTFAGGISILKGLGGNDKHIKILNTIVANNESVAQATGILTFDSFVDIVNCTIVNNNGKDKQGNGVYAEGKNTLIQNSIIWGNSGGQNNSQVNNGVLKNCAIQGKPIIEGTSLIDLFPENDNEKGPKFISPTIAPGTGPGLAAIQAAIWDVNAMSVLVGAGLTDANTPTTDILGVTRHTEASPLGSTIGAYEKLPGGVKTIKTLADLKAMATAPGAYKLGADITVPDGEAPFAFKGSLDGAGHKITFNNGSTSGGLFSSIAFASEFINLNIVINKNITSENSTPYKGEAGAFIGRLEVPVVFKNVSVTLENNAKIVGNGRNAGGFVGTLIASTSFIDCSVNVKTGSSITAVAGDKDDNHVGGLIGRFQPGGNNAGTLNFNGCIVNIEQGGLIASLSTTHRRTGGFLGWVESNNPITFINCALINAGELGSIATNPSLPTSAGNMLTGGFCVNTSNLVNIKSSVVYSAKGAKMPIIDQNSFSGVFAAQGVSGLGIETSIFITADYQADSLVIPSLAAENITTNMATLDLAKPFEISANQKINIFKTEDRTASNYKVDATLIGMGADSYVVLEQIFLKGVKTPEMKRAVPFKITIKGKVFDVPFYIIASNASVNNILYVNAGNTDATFDGKSWEKAFGRTRIQEALNKLGETGGGLLKITSTPSNGTAFGTSEQANVGILIPSFTVPAGVTVSGGWDANSDAQTGTSKFTNSNVTKNRVFILEPGASIKKLEVSGGSINATDGAGAGVWAKEYSIIDDCIITENQLVPTESNGMGARGAGVMMEFGAIIRNSEVIKNKSIIYNGKYAGHGGGVFINGSKAIIENSLIAENLIQKKNSGNYGAFGGGIFIGSTAQNVIVKNSVIRSNILRIEQTPLAYVMEGNGGGIYIEGANNIVEGCTIINNKAGELGGIPSIKSDEARGQQNGGGIYVEGVNSTVRNNKIYGNYSGQNGGGLFVYGNNALIYNNVVAYNHVEGGNNVGGDGGGIYCNVTSNNAKIYNTTVVKNSSVQGTSVYGAGSDKTLFDNSIAGLGYIGKIGATSVTGKNLVRVKGANIIYYNDGSVTTINGKPETLDAISEGAKINISADGSDANWFKFKNATEIGPYADYTAELARLNAVDYSVTTGSPCVDKGKTITDIPAVDINGQPRPLGKSWDIGAYEMKPDIIVESITYEKQTSGEDVIITATLSHPNPIAEDVSINITYSGDQGYLLTLPNRIVFKSGSLTASARLRFKMIDKNASVVLSFAPSASYVSFDKNVQSTGSIKLVVPTFDQDAYNVLLTLSPESVKEGNQFKAFITLENPQRMPPMRMGIELKPQSDEEAFIFSNNEDGRILWIDYGTTRSNEISVKIEKRLGQQYGSMGKQINIGKNPNIDHSLNRMTCTSKPIKVTDVEEDDEMKVTGRLMPVTGTLFTNEKVDIILKLDSKLVSTEPMIFNLTFKPEIESVKGAQIKIMPKETQGKFVFTVPSVFARQDVTVSASVVPVQEKWLSVLNPESVTFSAGNTIYYVNATASVGGDGTSWRSAFKNIEDAYVFVSSTDGSEIRIAKGQYTLSTPLSINGWTRVSGSWNPEDDTRTVIESEYPWAYENQTIITGIADYRMFAISDSALVEGVKIVGSRGVTLGGKGILRNSEISNVVLKPTIDADVKSIFAPIQVLDPAESQTRIEDCYIHDNQIISTSTESAGAIYTTATGVTVSRCIIGNNRATAGAGALRGPLTLIDALVVHNQSDKIGAFSAVNAIIKQSTFVRNKGVNIIGGNFGMVQSSIVWGNLSLEGKPLEMIPAITYTGIDFALGENRSGNNIVLSKKNTEVNLNEEAPRFTTPTLLAEGYIPNLSDVKALGNWHLTTALANMGSPSVKGDDLIDLSHEKRIQNDVIDMGCYESSAKGKLLVTFALSDYTYTGKDIARDGKAEPVKYKVAFPMEGRIVPLKFKKEGADIQLDSPLDVGVYQVVADDPNWEITYEYELKKNTFTIKPREISVAIDNKEIVVKSSLPVFTYTVTKGTEEPRDAGKIVKMSVPLNANDKVGEYAITGVFIDSPIGNYKLVGSIPSGKLIVKKQRITKENIIWIYPGDGNSDMIYYNGQPRKCTVSFKNLTLNPSSTQYAVVDNSPIFPGTYSAFVRLVGNASDIFELTESAMIEYQIRKVDIKIVGSIVSKIYGDEDPVFTCKTEPALFGSDRLVTAGTVRAAGEDVGSYAIPTDTWSHIGYNVVSREDCSLSIEQAPLTVTPNPVTHSVDMPLDSSIFTTTIIGFKRMDTVDDVYEKLPTCWPVTLDSLIHSTIEVQVDSETLKPNGRSKSTNYTAIAAKGTIFYTASSNQKLEFASIGTVVYGESITMKTTSNKGEHLPFVYESSHPDVLTVKEGNVLEAKSMGTATITVKQQGDAQSDIQATQASQLVVVNPKTIEVTVPIQKTVYDSFDKQYDATKVTFKGVLSKDILLKTISNVIGNTPGKYDVTIELTDPRYVFENNQSLYSTTALDISKATVKFETSDPENNYIYNADTQFFTGKIKPILPSGLNHSFFVDSVYGARDVGTHDVSVWVYPGNEYFTGSKTFSNKIRIKPAEMTVDFKDTQYVKAQSAVLPILQKEDFVYEGLLKTDTVLKAPSYKTQAVSTSPVGEYPMTLDTQPWRLNVNRDNYIYKVPTKVVNLKITAHTLTLDDCNIDNVSHTFNGKPKVITVTPKVPGTFEPQGVKCEYKNNGVPVNSPWEPGIYDVTIYVGAEQLGSAKMTIKKADLMITFGERIFIYDAKPKEVSYTIKPKESNDIYYNQHIGDFSFSTIYNGSAIPPRDIGIYRVDVSIHSNLYYNATATINMTIARLPAQAVGFDAMGATVTEPAKYGEVVHTVTVKTADGKPVRSGLLLNVNASGSISTNNYEINPKVLDFNGDSMVTFDVKIFNRDEYLSYNDEELVFTLASATGDLRVDGLLQYKLRIKNIDLPDSAPRAQFFYAPAPTIREGESVSALITSNSKLGEAIIKVKSSSKDLKFKIRHGSLTYDQSQKEINISLDGMGNAQIMVDVERSYTAIEKNSTIQLFLSKVIRNDGSKDLINGAFDTFAVVVTPVNPLLAPVAFSAQYNPQIKMTPFDVLPFVRKVYSDKPVYGVQLSPIMYVESITTEKGAIVSVVDQQLVYAYASLPIKNPELGFDDKFTAYLSDGFGGMTQFDATIVISEGYTYGSTYSIKPADFVNPYGAKFTKTPSLSGQYIKPFATIKAGKTVKPSKASMRTKMVKDKITHSADSALVEVTGKIKLVNSSNLSKLRAGKLVKIAKPKTYFAPVRFLDAGVEYPQVVVASVGVNLIGKGNCAKDNKLGDNLGALVISHPVVTDSFKAVGIGDSLNDKVVYVISGDFFGAKPVGYLEYRKPNGTITTTKLRMINSTKSKLYQAHNGETIYTAPTKEQMKQSATKKSMIMFYAPNKITTLPGERIDFLIDSGSGLSGAKSFMTY